jgi:glutaminyl-peptide cyclotransferase
MGKQRPKPALRPSRQRRSSPRQNDLVPKYGRRYKVVWIAVLLTAIGLTAAAVVAAIKEQPSAADIESQSPVPRSNDVVPLHGASPRRSTAKPVAEQNPLHAERAYGYLEQICALGPRISGSRGMLEQVRLLRKHFTALGGRVSFQQFVARNPLGGPNLRMLNTIVQWHPEKKERILLCAHYDTRPLPDRDPNPVLRREGTFIGANDGASGVAALMELAHHMPQLNELPFGVDFVFFDGEELVYIDGRDPYFLGSSHFARHYVKDPPPYKYRWGVLLDMVGDADLQIYQEQFSASWRDTRPLVAQIWGTAQHLGVSEFIAQRKHQVQDDHLPLRNIAKIPTCDIIDFDYPPWHTTDDIPARCSGESLATVGWVVYEWLRSGAPRADSSGR